MSTRFRTDALHGTCMRMMLAGAIAVTCVAAAADVRADDPQPDALRHFEKAVRPVLVEHCLKCHGPEKQWGSLRLDSREALLKGGDTGPAIISREPEQSLLIRAVRHVDDELKMPPAPKEKLTDRQIADLVLWIKQGAAYPASAPVADRKKNADHWSFKPPAVFAVPLVEHTAWPKSPVDHFVLARLEHARLTPTGPSAKRTLIRRATFDLIGLPPTADEIADFLADEHPDAFDRLIDRLLASPAYGERWGRHWLDVARYADSNGLDENVAHGNAWRYRDYVVDAMNRDTPYDQFLIEQLAGDLIPAADAAERNRNLIATGFLAIGPKVLAEVDEAKMQMDIIDEQIDTVGRAVLGLTLGCARCHDHKFDPIATADYYGLAGIFKSTRTMEHFKKVAKWYENPLTTATSAAAKAAFDEQVAVKRAAIQTLVERANEQVRTATPASPPSAGGNQQAVPATAGAGKGAAANPESQYPETTRAELKRLRDELAAFEKTAPEMPMAMGATEDKVVDAAIHIRGNPLKLGETIPRRVPLILQSAADAKFTADQSGRLELARSFTSPQHPLTGRVIVNRAWRWHFGKGLVRTPDNFGLLGELPTHPELLDWTARRFTEQGWSLKRLHRLIMLSSTYQQDSLPAPALVEHDPENRLFGRFDVRRLEAEEIRDALIAVGGRLDQAMGGSLLTVKNRAYFFDHTSKDLTDYNSPRRSLYLPIVRNNVYDVFQLLDYPDAAIPTGDRTTTTIAPQALMMLNSDFIAHASADLATRVLGAAVDDKDRVNHMYVTSYGREATSAEIAESLALLANIEHALPKNPADDSRRQAWAGLCQVIVAANEFIYVQ